MELYSRNFKATSATPSLAIPSKAPDLTISSLIHDNGCSYGDVTMAIMESKPPPGIQIYATVINSMFLAQINVKLSQSPSWPVKADTMDSCKSIFSDKTSALSFTNFVFAELADDVVAAKNILWTLKRGSIGVVATRKVMLWRVALQNA
jgi:hypothetical protein